VIWTVKTLIEGQDAGDVTGIEADATQVEENGDLTFLAGAARIGGSGAIPVARFKEANWAYYIQEDDDV
jgi:hypothetical protein